MINLSKLGRCIRAKGEFDAYCNSNINKQVGPNEAVTGVCRSIVDGLLREQNGSVDEKRLAEYKSCDGSPRRESLCNGPPEDLECRLEKGKW